VNIIQRVVVLYLSSPDPLLPPYKGRFLKNSL
jgi:hypothetical protein